MPRRYNHPIYRDSAGSGRPKPTATDLERWRAMRNMTPEERLWVYPPGSMVPMSLETLDALTRQWRTIEQQQALAKQQEIGYRPPTDRFWGLF